MSVFAGPEPVPDLPEKADPPTRVAPTKNDVRAHTWWLCKLVVEYGNDAEVYCAPGWEDLVEQAREALQEFLYRVCSPVSSYIGSWNNVVEDLEGEIHQRLLKTAQENWPV